jgi:glycosyltransferase involved in cell wall biosynthesis
MACAKPTVVTPSGGMVESVVPDQTGFFVNKRDPDELAEKILTLLRDKDLATRMGQAGRRRAVETFSSERMARDTVEVYQAAMERHRAGAPA